MKFKVGRETLLQPLQLVSGVIERRQTLPVLSNIHLKVAANVLTLTGTDLEVEWVGKLPVTEAEDGEITASAQKMLDICRNLPEGAEIAFDLEEERVLLRSGNFRSSLSTIPAADFPTVDRSEILQKLTLPAAALHHLIEQTSFAMAQQDVRYFLNGMLLELTADHVRAVATDGHRLAMSNRSDKFDIANDPLAVIVPRKGVLELQKLVGATSGDIVLMVGSSHVGVETSDYVLTSKLVDGRFPDYERVIPRSGDKVVVGNLKELRHALNRTAILSNEKFRGIKVGLQQGTVKLSANNPEQEEAEESVGVDYTGDDLEVGFNVGYLLDVLGVLKGDKVKITLSDSNSSALLEAPEDEESVYVVMPMKL